MDIKSTEFIKSVVSIDQCPKDNRYEIAFVGKSNVGKSSLINALLNKKKLARVSNTPGRTRVINYFLIDDKIYFVDLPGYGYAKVSKEEKAKWGVLIEDYLLNRPQIKKVVLLIDSRHKPTNDDVMMYEWIKHYNHGVLIVCTKSDKISKNEMVNNEKIIRQTLGLKEDEDLIFFSSTKKLGREQLLTKIIKED